MGKKYSPNFEIKQEFESANVIKCLAKGSVNKLAKKNYDGTYTIIVNFKSF